MTGNIPVYSVSWARSIIEKLTENHTRATEIVLKKIGLSPNGLALLLACHRQEFYVIRETIRLLDKNVARCQKEPDEEVWAGITTWALSRMLEMAGKYKLEGFIYYLTKQDSGPKL